MRIFSLVIACFIFTSCFMSEREIPLPGKIAVSSPEQVCSIFDNSDKRKVQFKLRDDNEISYGGLTWANQDDSFIGIEYLETATRGTSRGNVVRFDLSGNIIERIYESQEGEIAGSTYPSRNDKRLLFASQNKGDIKVNPLEGLSRMQSLVIMDLNQKKVVKRIENIGVAANFELRESPWLYDEDRFIYSISGENKIKIKGETINPVEEESAGVYVYDLTTDKKKLLIQGGRFGISSPTNFQLAFIKGQSVWMLDLKSNATKMIYEAGTKEKVSNIHWTPDGKCIYLVYFDYYVSDFFTSGEKLIEVSSSKEVGFKKIGQGFGAYSWK